GMAHRGRLNVLANIIGKPPARIFREFDGDLLPGMEGGADDVKYHLGAKGTYETPVAPIEVEVVANPSHLEAVDPVLEGVARAKQDKRGKGRQDRVLQVLLRGYAAYAGPGVVGETHHLPHLPGSRTRGTIHIVINIRVGFTTSEE